MNLKLTFFALLLFCLTTVYHVNAQVGIGTTTPNPNAALDIESTSQGVLIPRMTKGQRELIGGGSPAAGMLVYQTDDTAGFYFYDGTAWVSLSTKTPSGLETVDEGNGIGLVRIGRNPDNYGNVGLEAMDLSYSSFTSTTMGATGTNSTAMGNSTRATGGYSTAIGYLTIAESYAQTTLGMYNVPTTPLSTTAFNELDQLFVVGNGYSFFPSNALTILKNGTITAPSFDISEITDEKALITKEYGDNYFKNSGLESIDEGDGIGLVRVGRNPLNYGNVGLGAIDLSDSGTPSTTRGATGPFSVAMGYATIASGQWSTAMGYTTVALGESSTAMGSSTTASGIHATAMGRSTTALGIWSTAMGYNTKSESRSNLAIGEFNVGGGDPTNFMATDPLFEIGNGTEFNRSNALTVLKNGTITAPSFDISEITDAKALITKEYFDANKFSANYDDLFNQPILFDGDYNDLYNVPAPFSADYNDLINTPVIEPLTGLETIDEGTGNGLAKIGRNPLNYGNIGVNGVDLSTSVTPSNDFGATGANSIAMGYQTEASNVSTTAMGRNTKATGLNTTAIGFQTTAEGSYSTSMGFNTTAKATFVTAIGRNNIGFGDATAWIETDPIFEIGNGQSTPSNALTVLKNGTLLAPSFDMSEIADNRSLITKEYADANYLNVVFSGDYNDLSNLPSLFNGDYNSLINLPTLFSGNYNDLTNLPTIISPSGLEAIDEGNGIGFARVGRVSANYGNLGLGAVDLSDSSTPSITRGATGAFSVAMGGGTTALGIVSTAIGNNTTASGIAATAMGDFTIASGDYTTALGNRTRAEAFASTAIGRYNVGGGNPTGINPTDPVFEIGNGTSNTLLSNALTVFKNGNATLAGNLTENSDFRLKKNIQPLENSLVKLLKLEGKNYYWNDLKPHSKDLQIGLIAQDLENVFPELVHTGSDGYKSVDYTSLIPVIIEATKSQQEIIDTQNKRIKALEEQNRILLTLEARLKALENDKNTSNFASESN